MLVMVKIFRQQKEQREKGAGLIDVPGRAGQKGARKMCSGGFGSQGAHLPLTQWQRSPGPAAAHRVGVENARQDGGV